MAADKVAIIVGAGPAGLTAAHEMLETTEVHPVIFEESAVIGGISQTVKYNGNRMDIGGHRFFSKNKRVTDWWNRMMPLQGALSQDDILLQRTLNGMNSEGPDPAQTDRVMLLRSRISRIFYLRSFFDYPISLKLTTFVNMGLVRTLKAGFGYLWSTMVKRPDDTLENFYINRFGKPLYKMFFEDYTTKVWGVHPSKLGADWGSQRVKGLSVFAILKDMLRKSFSKNVDQSKVETSLIEQFIYPKLGPGQLWETVAAEVEKKGGDLFMQTGVKEINIAGGKVVSATVDAAEGSKTVACDYLLSTMPIKDLVASLRGIEVPTEVKRIAKELPYRDFITVGLLVDKMKIKNETKIKTYKNRVPDTWIYIQERDVKIGRLQVFNNWSPYLVADYEGSMWIGLEYFCSEGDELWQMTDEAFIKMAIEELVKIDMLDAATDVKDACRIKIKKAYPSYFGSYYELDKVKDFLDGIEGLFCIGRNGQHRYNNMDHSMLTAMEAVDNIAKGVSSKANVWAVNTEEGYHETKNKEK